MSRELHYALSDGERMQLFNAIHPFIHSSEVYSQANILIQIIGPRVKSTLPRHIVNACRQMSQGQGPQLLSLHNLPRDNTVPEDDDLATRLANKSRVSELCLLAITSLLEGQLQEETSSHQQGFIHQVTPVKHFLAECSGRGGGAIPFHAENMFIKHSPRFLSLYCLRGEAGVETEYIYVEDIMAYLSDDNIAILKQPLFSVVSGDGFERKQLNNVAILDEMGNGWNACRFYEEDRLFSNSEAGRTAIKALHKAIELAKSTHTKSVELEAGTLLLFANAIRKNHYGGVLHGRKGEMSIKMSIKTQSQFQQAPRWLQRVCIDSPISHKCL